MVNLVQILLKPEFFHRNWIKDTVIVVYLLLELSVLG